MSTNLFASVVHFVFKLRVSDCLRCLAFDFSPWGIFCSLMPILEFFDYGCCELENGLLYLQTFNFLF